MGDASTGQPCILLDVVKGLTLPSQVQKEPVSVKDLLLMTLSMPVTDSSAPMIPSTSQSTEIFDMSLETVSMMIGDA